VRYLPARIRGQDGPRDGRYRGQGEEDELKIFYRVRQEREMNIFISWSGDISRLAAEAFKDWLPNVIQAIDPWISHEDIDKGSFWSSDLTATFSEAKAGIICVTPDNQAAPWLNYEAGALTRIFGKNCVSPYLIGLKKSELKAPLSQFQATEPNEEDTKLLIKTLNKTLSNKPLEESKLESSFAKWWPELDAKLKEIQSTKIIKASPRPDRDIMEELLSLARMQTNLVSDFSNKLNTLIFLETKRSQPMSSVQFQAVTNQIRGKLCSFFATKGIKIMSIDLNLKNKQIDILAQQEISNDLLTELCKTEPEFVGFTFSAQNAGEPNPSPS